MDQHRRFLLAIDDSEDTERAARYLGSLLAGRSGVEVSLLHVLPPLPQELLETGGAPDEETEARIEAEQEEEQRRWIRERSERARPLFARVRDLLLAAGLSREAIREHAFASIPEDAIYRRILDAARECACTTVVLGRGPRTWIRDLLNMYVTHDVVRHAEGFTVWVVA